jgi:hypothetical protein
MGDVWKWGKQAGGQSWRTAGDLGGSFEGIGKALFRDGFDVYSQDSSISMQVPEDGMTRLPAAGLS